jgi:hypothetical protein
VTDPYAPQLVTILDAQTMQREEAKVTFGHANENTKTVFVCKCGCSDFEIVPDDVLCKQCRAPARGWFD